MPRLSCLKCWSLLPADAASKDTAVCTVCGNAWSIDVFPALLYRPAALRKKDLELAEGEASCFNHASKRAVTSCASCGRFLCALCSLELGEETWCGDCLSTGASKQRIRALETRRTIWDSIALALAVIPPVTMVGLYFLVFTAPAAIFLALRHWSRPGSLLPRSKVRPVAAIAIALADLGLWFALLFSMIMAFGARSG